MNLYTERPAILSRLRELKVVKVTCEYDGEGDEGQLEYPEFFATAGGKDFNLDLDGQLVPYRGIEISDAVRDLFYEILGDEYSGWENDNGACGQLVWDVTKDKIHLTHNEKYIAYKTEEKDL